MMTTLDTPTPAVRTEQARTAARAMAAVGDYEKAAEFLDLEIDRTDVPYTNEQRFPMMEDVAHYRSMPGLVAAHGAARHAEIARVQAR